MAIFGKLEVVANQIDSVKFRKAFNYLKRVITEGSIENKRLLSLPIDASKRVDLDVNNFGLEQIYISKNREECFFESHKQYIDVQFILKGEEVIEVSNIGDLLIDSEYNNEMDLIKYKTTKNTSIIRLQKGDVAIFYPDDAHMPCIKLDKSLKVVKTVVKVVI